VHYIQNSVTLNIYLICVRASWPVIVAGVAAIHGRQDRMQVTLTFSLMELLSIIEKDLDDSARYLRSSTKVDKNVFVL